MGCNEPREKYPKPRNRYGGSGGYPDYEFAPGDQVVPVHPALDFALRGTVDMHDLITHMMIVVDYNWDRMGFDTREWIVDDPLKIALESKHGRSSWVGHQLAPIVDKDRNNLFTAWLEWQSDFFKRRLEDSEEKIYLPNGRPRCSIIKK